jgi:hypothetical protein
MAMSDGNSNPWEHKGDEEAPPPWGTWLRDRLEHEPTWEDDAEEQGPSRETASELTTNSVLSLSMDLKALREAVDALPSGPDPEILSGLESLTEAVTALPAGPDAAALGATYVVFGEVIARMEVLSEAVEALPSGSDPEILSGLALLTEAVTALPAGPDAEVIARMEVLSEAIAVLPTGPDPEVVSGLESLTEAVTALPAGPDAEVIARMEVLSEAIAVLPTGPDPEIVAELHALRDALGEAMARPSSTRDPDVVLGLHSLRRVVEALVDLLADLPAGLRAVNGKVDEQAKAVARVLSVRAGEAERIRHLDGSIAALGRRLTEHGRQLAEAMELVTRQQTRIQQTSEATNEALASLAETLKAADRPAVPLDQGQIRAIATAVAEHFEEADPAPRPPPEGAY